MDNFTSIKVTIDDNHVFDLENMIYFMLLSKRKCRIIICINDLIDLNTSNVMKNRGSIFDQISFLERCGVKIHKIIKYSDYSHIAFLYLNRYIYLCSQDISIEPLPTLSDLDVMDKLGSTIERTNRVKLLHNFFDRCVVKYKFNKDEFTIAERGTVCLELYDAIIDDVIRANHTYNLISCTDVQTQKEQDHHVLLNIFSSVLGLKISDSLARISSSGRDILRCPIHLLSPSCFNIVTDIGMYEVDDTNIESELIRVGLDVLKRIDQQIFDIDMVSTFQSKDSYKRLLVNPYKLKIEGKSPEISIGTQKFRISNAVYLDKDFENALSKCNSKETIRVRLRFGTNIIVRQQNGQYIGRFDSTKRKKTKLAFDWLPESNNLLRFINATNDNTNSCVNVYYFDNDNGESIKDKIGIVKYNGQMMYTVPIYTEMNSRDINMSDEDDWFALPDLSINNIVNNNNDQKKKETCITYRMYPIIQTNIQ
jgi:hypothetical protein